MIEQKDFSPSLSTAKTTVDPLPMPITLSFWRKNIKFQILEISKIKCKLKIAK